MSSVANVYTLKVGDDDIHSSSTNNNVGMYTSRLYENKAIQLASPQRALCRYYSAAHSHIRYVGLPIGLLNTAHDARAPV